MKTFLCLLSFLILTSGCYAQIMVEKQAINGKYGPGFTTSETPFYILWLYDKMNYPGNMKWKDLLSEYAYKVQIIEPFLILTVPEPSTWVWLIAGRSE